MVAVSNVDAATVVGSGRTSRHDPTAEAGAMPAQRALVRVTPASPAIGVSIRPANSHAAAPFLAHLIATAQGAPQTRERRRTDPNWATTAYAAIMQVPASAGRAVRESR